MPTVAEQHPDLARRHGPEPATYQRIEARLSVRAGRQQGGSNVRSQVAPRADGWNRRGRDPTEPEGERSALLGARLRRFAGEELTSRQPV